MAKVFHKKTIFCACAALFALLLAAGGICSRVASHHSTIPLERYYRAVYVLSQISQLAAAEHEMIPPGIAYTDESESLLHHPDKILVLGHLAEEFASLRSEAPRAALYESYARLGLGERKRASSLLMRYVVEQEYHAEHYLLLCDTLYALGDYTSLLLMCREWAERASEPRKDCTHFLWTALYNLKRYDEAAELLTEKGECLGWRASVYAAKTALAKGEEETANTIIKTALEENAANPLPVQRLWDMLKNRDSI